MAVILVADDHPLNRHFLTTLLSYYGHEVLQAADGVEALEAAQRRRPDLIIADVAMPRMDGPALVRALRADAGLAAIPIIFYTASYREVESRAIAAAAGVAHVITKPADPEVILETVQRALGARGEPAWRRAGEYLGRLQTASIRMSALIELTLHLSAERDPHALLRTACHAVRTIFGAHYAVIALVDAARNVTSTTVEGEAALPELIAQLTDRDAAASNLGTVLFLPMTTPHQVLYGWLMLGKGEDVETFTTDDERLAMAAASQIRAEHESLRETDAELRTSREQLRARSARVLSIQEEERTRLARELHDDLGQLLTAIKIDVARLVQDLGRGAAPPPRVMEGIVPLIENTIDTVGRIVSELRPTRIGEIGLAGAIEKKLAELQQRTDIECELSIRPAELWIGNEAAATAAFRILEEALTNVARHSGATRAEVLVRQNGKELLLEVRDNGRGIREGERRDPGAYGLIGMRERAGMHGGSLEITGIEGRGTIVTARIPLGGDPRAHR